MAHKLDFKGLDEIAEKDPELIKTRTARWGRREANPTVQASVRMREDVYERFRALCLKERRTNGDMLEILLQSFLENSAKR